MTPEEFARRYEESRRTLWFIAAAVVGDRTLAHDVVQEAAAIAMVKRGEFDATTNFTAWMGQIVRYVALNEGRARQRRRAVIAPEGEFAQSRAQAMADAVSGTELKGDEKVMAGLMTLDEVARTCLVLRIVHGLSYTEISRALSLPEGTAMSHVHRSRLALRERLGGPTPRGKSA